ncbi:MAG: DMT family transporter [Gammaproteobacteria bacterium]|nr:MAG: DMT family transporter [Gammaproteobacteria bacterium]
MKRPVDAPDRQAMLGISLMLGATIAFAGMSACVKELRGDGFSTAEVVFYRSAPGLPLLWWSLRRRGLELRPGRPRVLALRSAYGLGAMVTNFYAVRALTLVQHTVIHLLQPVLVAALAPWVISERLRGAALVALALAVTGALTVVLPGQGEISSPPLVPAAIGASSALFSALAHLTVRKTLGSEPPERVVFHFALHASLASAAWATLVGEISPITSATTAATIAAMAAFGLIGQVLMTRAYHSGRAAEVAMVAYAGIPVSMGLDAWLWDAPAGLSTVAGAALMVLAGALIARAPAAKDDAPVNRSG